MGLAVPALTLDAHLANDSASFTVTELIFEGLFRLTDEGPIPWLASDAKVSADGMTWTVTLHDGVMFHDGTPFDAEAVRANIQRIQQGEEGFVYKGLIATITDIKVNGPASLDIQLSQPSPALPSVLSFTPFYMQSPTAVAKFGVDYGGTNVAGTGPFRVSASTPGGDLTLARNEAYWGDRAFLDQVVFRTIKDGAARVASLESGDLQIATMLAPTDVARLKDSDNIAIEVIGTPRQALVYINNLKAPLDKSSVRQAVMYGTNRPAYVETLLQGLAEQSDSMVGKGVFGYAAQTPYPYDPTKARALLAQAGVAEGTTFELATIPLFETHAAAIAQDLAQVGLDIKVVTMDLSALLEYMSRPPETSTYQMVLATRTSQYGDAELPLVTDYHSANWAPAGANRTFYKNTEADALLAATRVETDPARREQQFADAIALIWHDLPALPIYRTAFAVGVQPVVQDLVITPYERLRLEKAWLLP